MNYKTFLTVLALAAVAIAPVAYAQEPIVISTEFVAPAPIVIDPTQIMINELVDLKAKESDPTTGFFERFFIKLKIRELEHKLNLTEAFQ